MVKETLEEIGEEQLKIGDVKAENIYSAIWGSRNYPGVSLENIAEICGTIFDKAEMEAFVEQLKKVIKRKYA